VHDEPDHYALLGVTRDASAEDIKRAFRLLVNLWHPDYNKRDDASERFDKLSKAREVLLDPKRRAEYDRNVAHAEAGSSSADDKSSAHDDEETAVIIEPRTIDFGILEAGGPGVTAQVTLTWTGPESGLTVPQRGDWWTRTEIKRPGVKARYVITLHAKATARTPAGNHRSHFTIIANGVPQPVELMMRAIGSPFASSRTNPSTYAPWRATAPARSAARWLAGLPAPLKNAVKLMFAGAGLAVILAAETTLASTRTNPYAGAYGVFLLFCYAGPWVWMAIVNKRGRHWARSVATLFCGVWTLATVVGVPAHIKTAPVQSILEVSLWLVGLAATVLMWRPASTAYYRATSRRL
jgi:curved DNA-binding protein CbpA